MDGILKNFNAVSVVKEIQINFSPQKTQFSEMGQYPPFRKLN